VSEQEQISAEIQPTPNHAELAARQLQQLGFRVLHIGPTISVDGPRFLWEQTFHIGFQLRRKQTMAGVPESEVTFYQPTTDVVSVPENLRDVVAEVSFVEPPEFFSSG
jgi:hypothetical protein